LKLSDEGEFGFWRPVAKIYCGWALAQGREIEAGIAQIREGLEEYRESGAAVGWPTFLALLAEAYCKVGQPTSGLEALNEAYTAVKQSGERWSEPELYRLEGELTLKLSQTKRPDTIQQKRAEICFRRAVELAQDQKAKLLELRATINLHRLWATQGKCGESRRRLKEIYGGFTEGLNTPDLIEAAELIEGNT
jgi:adenylate cyclase